MIGSRISLLSMRLRPAMYSHLIEPSLVVTVSIRNRPVAASVPLSSSPTACHISTRCLIWARKPNRLTASFSCSGVASGFTP